MSGSIRTYVLGAILGMFAIAGLTWVVGISPRIDRASVADEDRLAQEDFNAILAAEVEKLKQDAELVPEYKEAIYDIRDDLPNEIGIPDLRRTIAGIYENAGLVVTREQIGSPRPLTPNISLAPQSKAVGIKSQVDGQSFNSVLAFPVSLELSGTPAQVYTLIDEFQRGDHRYVLVVGMNLSAVQENSESSGIPRRPGDLVVDLDLLVFTLDFGSSDIQTRPVAPVPPTCIDLSSPEFEGGFEFTAASETAEDGTMTVTSTLNGVTTVEVFDPDGNLVSSVTTNEDGEVVPGSVAGSGDLTFCEDAPKPPNYNPFLPLS